MAQQSQQPETPETVTLQDDKGYLGLSPAYQEDLLFKTLVLGFALSTLAEASTAAGQPMQEADWFIFWLLGQPRKSIA